MPYSKKFPKCTVNETTRSEIAYYVVNKRHDMLRGGETATQKMSVLADVRRKNS